MKKGALLGVDHQYLGRLTGQVFLVEHKHQPSLKETRCQKGQ